MNQESGQCKIDFIQHCNLAAFERAVEGNCGAINAVDTMVKVRAQRTQFIPFQQTAIKMACQLSPDKDNERPR